MSGAPNFGAILDRQSSEVSRPKPLPVGTYLCVTQGLPKFDKSTKKGTEFVEWELKILQAMDDVDPEALEASLTKGDGSRAVLSEKSIRATFYLTENSVWRLTKFLDDLGVEEEGMSIRQRIDLTPGHQVLASLRHEASEDGENVFARLGNTAPVE